MNNLVKLFVVEGENREVRFINLIINTFLQGKFAAKVITLSAAQNIYMLYQILKEDDFETDLVEVLRDHVPDAKKKLEGISRQDVSEIYMFFDYDVQQNNLKGDKDKILSITILKEMLSVFNNETEDGKLYISYPMVEALYDYRDGMCQPFSSCFIDIDQLDKYKMMSGSGNPKAVLQYQIDDWKEIINVFVLRAKCLFQIDSLNINIYRNNIEPSSIFHKQINIKNENHQVFVLSGLPEFLLDYFKSDFWNSMVKRTKPHYDYCMKET